MMGILKLLILSLFACIITGTSYSQRVTLLSEEAYVYPDINDENCKMVKVKTLITFTDAVAIIDQKDHRPLVLRLGEWVADQSMGNGFIMKGRYARDNSGGECFFGMGYISNKIVTIAVSTSKVLIVYIISEKDKSKL